MRFHDNDNWQIIAITVHIYYKILILNILQNCKKIKNDALKK